MNFLQRKLYSLFPGSEFTKNVLKVFTGTAVAQIIPFVFSPVLSRIYSPSDYGALAIILGFAGVLSVPACGRYDLAVMLPEDDKDSASLVILSLIISLIFSVSVLIAFFFFQDQLLSFIDYPQLGSWLLIIPLLVFFMAAYQPFNYWLLRKKEFARSSYNKIAQTSFIVLLSILFGLLSIPGGLIIGYVAGWMIMFVVALIQAVSIGFPKGEVNAASRRKVAKEFLEYPRFNALPSTLNALSSSLPVFIISKFFIEASVGFFNFTRQIIGAPLGFISAAVSQVFFQSISHKKRQGEPVLTELLKIVKVLSVIGGLTIILFVLFGPLLFAFIFGEEWREAGKFSQILIFSIAVQFVVSPLSTAFMAVGKVKVASLWQTFFFFLTLILFLFDRLDIYQFLIAYTILDVFAYSVYFIMLLNVIRKHDRTLNVNVAASNE